MEKVINHKSKKQIRGGEFLRTNTSRTFSKSMLPSLNNLENIGFYTLSDYRVKQTSITSPIWRCEILLTNKCNFNCPYCRDNLNSDKKDADIDDVKLLISKLSYYHSLKNLRFSGGEPTLYEGLKDLVKLSKSKYVERIAISTNGSASFEYYKELIKCGVNDYSISLDACCASDAKKMGCKSARWNRVVDNIKKLSKLTYVTAGIVINENNISQTQQIIDFAYKLGVSDIRIISSAQYNKPISLLKINVEILAKNPILNYRVRKSIKGIAMRGLLGSDTNRCPLVLDDIAVRDGKHYPCIIYLREGGEHIGYISGEIRQTRYDYFLEHDTHQDKICKLNCLDVCRDYNNRYYKFNAVGKG